MQKFQKVLDIISGLIRNYPAISMALANIAVVVLAKYGLHVTATELVAIVTAMVSMTGLYVHQNVTPID